ncbi:hypothetical protein BP5796_07415 [Coleophoma crateriformis]|uniref:F-box domain-containing protein n=1 Tax=Coleophoma crateriformis TaxID=565419 RepID=A0A3D8RIU8_9HELO|nr:hypothetical protein BP5796_07415 [Coleophoma crateriformis]
MAAVKERTQQTMPEQVSSFVEDKKAGPRKSVAFDQLPDEIIEQILELTSPNSFASLIVLNRKWRMISQQSYLYAHHLSQCPSYRAAHRGTPPSEDEDSLPLLRRQFAHEVKRNLFDAYLRPAETVINLLSTSISSTSAPGGEAFNFSLSPKGHHLLAYSSSRIHVLDVTGQELVVKRELKIFRRPVSTTITDDGSLLAVLSTDLQVDIYDLTGKHPKHCRVVELDHTPRTIALSPEGSVLAAAYDSGVEVSSLDSRAGTDRRSVKCYAVDSLSFSQDGRQLLGTSIQSRNSSTVVLTAPYYDPGTSLPDASVSALWTTSILFPNGSRDCSHAVLLPSAVDDEASWTFTYDRAFETFRAVRIDDLRNGTTYFTGPIAHSGSVTHLLPSTLPAASSSGDLVAAGFQGSIWLYGVPEDLDAPTGISNAESEAGPPSPIGNRNSALSSQPINRQPGSGRVPQWQILCDRFRNTFVEGRKASTLMGVSAMTWISQNPRSHAERLVAVAPGVGEKCTIDDDGMSPTDGGRITILDFDYNISNGRKRVLTIEVGQKEPEILEEEHKDLETEVALVRRRTVAQRQGNHGFSRPPAMPRPPIPAAPSIPSRQAARVSFGASSAQDPSQSADDLDESASVDEEEAFDAPYSQTNPRSVTTLRRAATAAANNRRLHPRAVAQGHIEYRRADGREEHPHESDADNWVPPPPPYSKEPVPTLPEHIQKSILAQASRKPQQISTLHNSAVSDLADLGSVQRSRTTLFSSARPRGSSLQRIPSDSTLRTSVQDDSPRPLTSPATITFDDIYDVSPPSSPRLATRQPAPAPIQISRKPVATGAGPDAAEQSSEAFHATTNSRQHMQPAPQIPADQLITAPTSTQDSRQAMPTPAQIGTSEPTATSSNAVLTREHLDKDLPPPPNDDHRLLFPPPTTEGLLGDDGMPKLQPSPPLPRRSETVPIRAMVVENEDILTIPKRSETAPTPPVGAPVDPHGAAIAPLSMPSADQLARLKSRKGRPRNLSNPSRPRAGSNPINQPHLAQPNQSASSSRASSRESTLRRSVSDPSRIQTQNLSHGSQEKSHGAPRAAAGAIGRSPSNSRLAPSNSPSHAAHPPSASPSRRVSKRNSNPRLAIPEDPESQPSMARLETIRSVDSAAEPSPAFISPKPLTLARTSSRAEKSAAKNIQDAKKRGWRASLRKDKSKTKATRSQDQIDIIDWTNLSSEHVAMEKESKSGGKCAVM